MDEPRSTHLDSLEQLRRQLHRLFHFACALIAFRAAGLLGQALSVPESAASDMGCPS